MLTAICGPLKQVIELNLDEILSRRSDRKLKPDGSYVTGADTYIQELVDNYLRKKSIDAILISEEQDNTAFVYDPRNNYVIVDPLDGTENFVSGLKEWGVGIAVYEAGVHEESMILLPELGESIVSGQLIEKFSSRIHGLSSSITKDDLQFIEAGFEYRIMGCSMYNIFNVIRGSYAIFQNVKGVNTWDILPGVNLALEHGCKIEVNGGEYHGEFLPPNRKYRIKIRHR